MLNKIKSLFLYGNFDGHDHQRVYGGAEYNMTPRSENNYWHREKCAVEGCTRTWSVMNGAGCPCGVNNHVGGMGGGR